MRQTAAWVAATDIRVIDTGLETEEALCRAGELVRLLGGKGFAVPATELDDAAIDILHAACQLLAQPDSDDLATARSLYEYISCAKWREFDLEERAELLSVCALMAWRAARRERNPLEASRWAARFDDFEARGISVTARVLQFPQQSVFSAEVTAAASHALGIPIADRTALARELDLEDPTILRAILATLRDRAETDPETVRAEAEFFYNFLERPKRQIGFLDERAYFLGESGLIAGLACRLLFKREEARRWFDRSETAFRHTANAVADLSRLTYQRLALRLEEREFDEVLGLLPSLIESFDNLEMKEDSLKCRFLQAVIFLNTARLAEAAPLFREICEEAKRLGSDRLAAIASSNLVQLHGLLGESDEALAAARRSLVVFQKLDNRVGLGKLQWGIGTLFRSRGQLSAAVGAYRSAQSVFAELGMRSDVASAHLVVADLLLELGRETEAISELLRALPIVEEEKMVPEGMAALSLLRESVRQRRINRQALRDLHGYFEDLQK